MCVLPNVTVVLWLLVEPCTILFVTQARFPLWLLPRLLPACLVGTSESNLSNSCSFHCQRPNAFNLFLVSCRTQKPIYSMQQFSILRLIYFFLWQTFCEFLIIYDSYLFCTAARFVSALVRIVFRPIRPIEYSNIIYVCSSRTTTNEFGILESSTGKFH